VFDPDSLGPKQALASIPFTDSNVSGNLIAALKGYVTEICKCDLNNDDKCHMQDWLLFRVDWDRTDCAVSP